MISASSDRKIPYKKIWESKDLQQALANYNADLWIFDGKKLAWAPVKIDRGEVRVKVDLDAARRKPGDPIKPGSEFRVVVRQTTEINLSVIQGYLNQKLEFTNNVLEAMNFIDHLMRAGPSKKFLAIKRNFYDSTQKGLPLLDGRVVEVHKGLYASARLSHNLAQGGTGLALNCDVANTSFWVSNQSFDQLCCAFLANCEGNFGNLDPATGLAQALKPVSRKDGQFESSLAFKQLRKLRRLKFTVKHKNRAAVDKVFTFQDLMFSSENGPEGATARNIKFPYEGKDVSVFDYYRIKYGVNLRLANLPLIDAGKGGAIPMELAFIEPMQRYMFKLNGRQTDAMIKIAVTRPDRRKGDIEQKMKMLNLGSDPYLRHYGVEFEQSFTQTPARIIAPPTVDFRQGRQEPRFSGRWRLDQGNIKFWRPNQQPLKNWGIVAMDGCARGPQALNAFVEKFRSIYTRHGGVCPEQGLVLNLPGNINRNGAEAVAWAHQQITQKRGYTQLLFIAVGFKNSPHYERLKKNADCRFGILSQVVVYKHVENDGGNAQYISNVCMKVNAKLGGATARTASPFKSQTYFPANRKTMIIGVDVSHAAPGGNTASIASMTMNCDADANRFAAVVETNGYRTEMVTPTNILSFFQRLGAVWRKNHNNAAPDHIMYFRDGVGEGQFSQVLDLEVKHIRDFLVSKGMKNTKFTVIVATKRHHIRFFPGPDQRSKGGDRNGNPKPGLVVEREVTHPFMWDFYLNSHSAIQGTARPVHYYVLLDEMNMTADQLQRIIYHQCYSYARSTTPVSIHPAIYYAHLAADRARHHENTMSSEGFRAGGKGHEMLRDRVAKGQSAGGTHKGMEPPPLLPLGGNVPPPGTASNMPPQEAEQRRFIKETMWFI